MNSLPQPHNGSAKHIISSHFPVLDCSTCCHQTWLSFFVLIYYLVVNLIFSYHQHLGDEEGQDIPATAFLQFILLLTKSKTLIEIAISLHCKLFPGMQWLREILAKMCWLPLQMSCQTNNKSNPAIVEIYQLCYLELYHSVLTITTLLSLLNLKKKEEGCETLATYAVQPFLCVTQNSTK